MRSSNAHMRTPPSLINLLHNKARTIVAFAGITFAIILIFMQLGFFGAVVKNAIIIYDNMNFDILIVSKKYVAFIEPGAFPRARLAQALAVPGVEGAAPVYT